MTPLQKPEKIFLHHPNLLFSLSPAGADVGNIRETFFINQVSTILPVSYAEEGDFTVGKYTFEIGGQSKQRRQVRHLEHAYVVADDIEIGHQHKIPLWLFGFFY